jgi:hypothetical protein
MMELDRTKVSSAIYNQPEKLTGLNALRSSGYCGTCQPMDLISV